MKDKGYKLNDLISKIEWLCDLETKQNQMNKLIWLGQVGGKDEQDYLLEALHTEGYINLDQSNLTGNYEYIRKKNELRDLQRLQHQH